MIALTYTLQLQQPLLATGIEGDPNSKRSLSYIPGSMIRGALVQRYAVQKGRSALDANDETDRRLFLGDATRFLNAYLTTPGGVRTLPAPATWMIPKGSLRQPGSPIYDWALDASLPAGEQPEPVGMAYCHVGDGSAALYQPVRRISVHTARDRRAGRATTGSGAVFQYDALAPGQEFSGAILVEAEEEATTLAGLLALGDLFMGGSRSAGYGRASVATVRIADRWRETDADPKDMDAHERLILTCLSPCIIRDAHGGLCADLHGGDLWKRLGIGNPGPAFVPERSRRGITILGGFNRTWGLPLCQAQAISAGSVFVYEVGEPIEADRLVSLMETGIGERRAEGFGRLGVNWQTSRVLYRADERKPAALIPPVPAIAERDAGLARRMAERLLRKELDRNLGQRTQELRLSPVTLQRDVIKNSQLSRLRVVVRSALAGGDLPRVRTFMEQLKRTAKGQFEEARLEPGNTKLFDWVVERLEHPDALWQQLTKPAPVQIGSIEVDVPATWAAEYTLRLIDGVLAQAAKDKKGRRSDERHN